MSIRTLTVALLALSPLSTQGQSPIAPAAAPSAISLQDRVDALSQQIHLRYRHHGPSLATRRDATEAVLRDWNRVANQGPAGASASNTERMAAWLDVALNAVLPNGSGRLPPAPAFEEALPPTVATEQVTPLPSPEPAVASPLVGPTVSRTKPLETVTPRVKPTETVETGRRAEPNDGRLPFESQFVGPRASRQSVAKPVTPAEPPRSVTRQPKSAEPERSKWSRHPSAAPLEWRDPFADDPAASPNPLRSGARRQALRPAFNESPTARINLQLLSAEVRGYNEALRALQAVVTNLNDADVFALAAAADELDHLEQRRQFLDLYRQGLSPRQLRSIPESPSAELVRELVRRKAEALTRSSLPERSDVRRALERLNDRLAGLSEASF